MNEVDWNSITFDSAVIELVPESVARENTVFPLRLEGETLFVAATNPSDVMLRDKLSFMVNKRILLVRSSSEGIRKAINQFYGQTETESVDSMLMDYDGDASFQSTVDTMSPPARHAFHLPKRLAGSWHGTPRGAMLAKHRDTISDTDLHSTLTADVSETMFFFVVREGQRILKLRSNGTMEVVVGPKKVFKWGSTLLPMQHHVAHPGQYLVVRFRDGRQEHLPGPAEIWFDSRIHLKVETQEALQLAAKEAVVVYTRNAETNQTSRRVVEGPCSFIPAPGEFLHTFSWHGATGGSQGAVKVSKGLVFQKLWLMPDQMYYDVTDVRTADNALLTIRLMIFFELIDINRMMDETHDPIGDFINAAASDVVDFTGHHTFENFKRETSKLNELETYRQLMVRAEQTGYRINKVVYRGYGAPTRLQAMHDQAIEGRTKLELDRATEEQAQELEDFKLNAQMARANKRRQEQSIEVEAELELARKRRQAELEAKERDLNSRRTQRQYDTELELEMRRRNDEKQREHLASLRELGVDLTALLTQHRADKVIELRGSVPGTHVHLDGEERNPNN
jgi:hypothetical protein